MQKNAIEIINDPNRQWQTYREARQIALEIVKKDKAGIKDFDLYSKLNENDLKRVIESMNTQKEFRDRIEAYKKNTRISTLKGLLENIDT